MHFEKMLQQGRMFLNDAEAVSYTHLAGNDRVLLNEDERRFLEPPKTDELYKVV